jgi:hypothetical protein
METTGRLSAAMTEVEHSKTALNSIASTLNQLGVGYKR